MFTWLPCHNPGEPLQDVDAKTAELVRQGLIVPRWSFKPEKPLGKLGESCWGGRGGWVRKESGGGKEGMGGKRG